MNIALRKGAWMILVSLPFIFEVVRAFLFRHNTTREVVGWSMVVSGFIYFIIIVPKISTLTFGNGPAIRTWLVALVLLAIGYFYLTSKFVGGFATLAGYALLVYGVYVSANAANPLYPVFSGARR